MHIYRTQCKDAFYHTLSLCANYGAGINISYVVDNRIFLQSIIDCLAHSVSLILLLALKTVNCFGGNFEWKHYLHDLSANHSRLSVESFGTHWKDPGVIKCAWISKLSKVRVLSQYFGRNAFKVCVNKYKAHSEKSSLQNRAQIPQKKKSCEQWRSVAQAPVT